MILDDEFLSQRIPTLVSFCQQVAAHHVDSIHSFGDGLPYDIVKPIIRHCSPEEVQRFELTSPHLRKGTDELWKKFCLRKHPVFADRYQKGEVEDPPSWRTQYFALHEAEVKRLEAIGSRLRSQRIEAEERKKESSIKLTDRQPPKRQRTGWSAGPTQPKSLFQKAKSEASKMQKSMYNSRVKPPVRRSVDKPLASSSKITPLLPPPSAEFSSRVVVKTVTGRPPALSVSQPLTSKTTSSRGSSATSFTTATSPSATSVHSTSTSTSRSSSANPPSISCPSSLPSSRPKPQALYHAVDIFARTTCMDLNPAKSVKKDPMASLFVPKYRAHPQRGP